MTDWKAKAGAAVKAGYVRGNPWESKLRRHLLKHCPALAKELGQDLEHYLVVRTADALAEAELLQTQGMTPDEAHAAALRDLLPAAEGQENRPQPWETLGAVEESLAGQIDRLRQTHGTNR
jgi:hypothetical protein